MHTGDRPARERIIAAELMKLERRQMVEQASLRAAPRPPEERTGRSDDAPASHGPVAGREPGRAA
jgi:hypothetical protein